PAAPYSPTPDRLPRSSPAHHPDKHATAPPGIPAPAGSAHSPADTNRAAAKAAQAAVTPHPPPAHPGPPSSDKRRASYPPGTDAPALPASRPAAAHNTSLRRYSPAS